MEVSMVGVAVVVGGFVDFDFVDFCLAGEGGAATAAALLLMLKSIVVASPPQYWQLWHLQNAQDGFLPSADGLQNGWQALYLKSPGLSDEQTAFDMEDSSGGRD